MATGKEMLEAVREAVRREPELEELRLSSFDACDLCKLTSSELVAFGVDPERAEQISADLMNGSLHELGEWLGLLLMKVKHQRSLIPGEGFRRTAGIWATGNDDPDSIVEEIRQLRHPGPR